MEKRTIVRTENLEKYLEKIGVKPKFAYEEASGVDGVFVLGLEPNGNLNKMTVETLGFSESEWFNNSEFAEFFKKAEETPLEEKIKKIISQDNVMAEIVRIVKNELNRESKAF